VWSALDRNDAIRMEAKVDRGASRDTTDAIPMLSQGRLVRVAA
jgi:hypothetical protein